MASRKGLTSPAWTLNGQPTRVAVLMLVSAKSAAASCSSRWAARGHDSPTAAQIYQHSRRVADEAIAAATDARLTARKSRPAPNVVGPVAGSTEPQLIAH